MFNFYHSIQFSQEMSIIYNSLQQEFAHNITNLNGVLCRSSIQLLEFKSFSSHFFVPLYINDQNLLIIDVFTHTSPDIYSNNIPFHNSTSDLSGNDKPQYIARFVVENIHERRFPQLTR